MSKTITEKFEPVQWYDDGPPAIEAKQLNRLEDAIGALYYRVFGTDGQESISDSDNDAKKTLIHALRCIDVIIQELDLEYVNDSTTLEKTSRIDALETTVIDNKDDIIEELSKIRKSIPNIVDNLNSHDTTSALSANQGSELNRRIVNLTEELEEKVGLIDSKYMLVEKYVDNESMLRVKDSAQLGGKDASAYVETISYNAKIKDLETRMNNTFVWKTF